MSWPRAGGIVAAALAIVAALASGLTVSCAVVLDPGSPTEARRGGDDVVDLKDGRRLRGTIVEQVGDTSLSLRTREGMVLVLQHAQIRRVQVRSALGAATSWVPVVRLPDSALVGRWVRIESTGIGTREGRVLRIAPETVVVTRVLRKTRIPRAAISNALVSTSQFRKVAQYAVPLALGGAAWMYFGSKGFMESTSSEALAAAAGGAVFGAVVGGFIGYFKVEHEGWRRLQLNPTSTAPPVSSGRVEVGMHVRR